MATQHTVVFRLVHAPGSAAEAEFLDTARATLTTIGGVAEFTINRQVSPKSDLVWQFSMAFAETRQRLARGEDPQANPRVLAVIATFLVRRVLWCGSLIGWFLRSIGCSGPAWRLACSSPMPRSRPAVMASKAAAGWLRWVESDLVEVGT